MAQITEQHITVNPHILEMEYAVRGPIPQRAAELQRQGKDTIFCNIGNPQALGQTPMTYYRQVLSLVEDPAKIARERRLRTILNEASLTNTSADGLDLISETILETGEKFLAHMKNGLGAYTESKGPLFIRESIARFINRRDNMEGADPNNIFITNGASEAVRFILNLLIAETNDGIMIPIPQYPLYSATIRNCGGVQVNYYPDEESGWVLHQTDLEEAYQNAQNQGVKVKAIVVINPANPTGAILDEKTMEDVVSFALEKQLVLIVDEVYQENVYGGRFTSFARILGDRPLPLFSLHSISKGFYGECGHRGGYLEIRNPPKVTGSKLNVTDLILKEASVALCSNTVGQLLVYLMVNPPEPGTEPYAQFIQEKESILSDLADKANMLREGFKQMEGVECFGRTGALYLFPRLNKMPEGRTDFDYCMQLLEETGLCTVNGAGFGQKEGTHHLRIAFLPPKAQIETVLPKWIRFHNAYVNQGGHTSG